MSPNKTLYIRDADAEVWERAEAIAKMRGTSLSQLATDGLRTTLPPINPAEDPEMATIEVATGEAGIEVGFIGKWLVHPEGDDAQTGEEGYDQGTRWGVALTKRGRIAVYVTGGRGRSVGELADYDSIEDAAEDVPEDVLASASNAVGIKRVIWRDI